MLLRKERLVLFHNNVLLRLHHVCIPWARIKSYSHADMIARCRRGLLDMHFQVVAVVLREWIYLLMGVKPGLRLADIRKTTCHMYLMDLRVISGLGFSSRLH